MADLEKFESFFWGATQWVSVRLHVELVWCQYSVCGGETRAVTDWCTLASQPVFVLHPLTVFCPGKSPPPTKTNKQIAEACALEPSLCLKEWDSWRVLMWTGNGRCGKWFSSFFAVVYCTDTFALIFFLFVFPVHWKNDSNFVIKNYLNENTQLSLLFFLMLSSESIAYLIFVCYRYSSLFHHAKYFNINYFYLFQTMYSYPYT